MFKTLELPGGLCPGPTGGLKRPPDPSPNNFLIPGYGPVHPLINYFLFIEIGESKT